MTRNDFGLALATVVCGLLSAGCSDDTATEEMVDATVMLTDFTETAVENAEVCVRETEECGSSDADGVLLLTIPPNTDLTLTIDAPGMFPLLYTAKSGSEDSEVALTMFQESLIDAAFAAVDVPIDAAKGHITHGIAGPGATVSSSPSSGVGPLYGTGGVIDPDAQNIPDTPTAGYGWGNVDPGAVTITITPPAGETCTTPLAWQTSAPGQVDIVVEAGRMTVAPGSTCAGD